jgi:hypothetical protein
MGPRVPDNTGANFKKEVDELFEPPEEENAQETEEQRDKKSE